MNSIILILGTFLVMTAMSCSNEFLEENNTDLYYVPDTLILTSNNELFVASLQIPAEKDYEFTIFMQPRWLSFPSVRGSMQDGTIVLTFSINHDYLSDWYQIYQGSIVLDAEDFGKISVPVRFTNYGRPVLEYFPHVIIFESANPQTLTIHNIGQGLLTWEIFKPDWLSMSETSGELSPGQSLAISLLLIPGKLTPGISYSGSITVLSNYGTQLLLVNVSAEAIIPAP